MNNTICLRCGEEQEVPVHYLGREVKCTSCQGTFKALTYEQACAEWGGKQDAVVRKLEAKLPLIEIYLSSDQESQGPFLYSAIKTMWTEGKIPENSKWWIDGMKEWSPIQALPFIRLSTPTVPIPGPNLVSSSSLFTILVAGEISGPYTIGQVRSLWSQGKITVTGQFKTQGDSNWTSFQEIVPLIEESNNGIKGGIGTQQNAIPVAQLRAISLQSRMKSPALAVVWGLLFPIFGAAYGSAFAMFFGLFLLIAGIAIGVRSDTGILVLAVVAQLISLYCSVVGVDSYNQGLLLEEEKRGD
jgi:hypothetical protein